MTPSGLRHFPLGEQVPASEHAVCVSLPTMTDVVGYETNDPKVINKIPAGYPRFVTHRLISRLINELLLEKGYQNRTGFALASRRAVDDFREFLTPHEIEFEERNGFVLAHAKESPELQKAGKAFLQHTGFSISSRQAEDILVARGVARVQQEEMVEEENASIIARRQIADAMGEEISPENILLATSGANAFHALFRGTRELLADQGRTIWIQLGWLYVDTIKVLSNFSGERVESIAIHNLSDLSELRKLFSDRGSEIAAVVTEVPTNPLFHTCDLDEVRNLCRANGAMLVADPTMASPRNVKVADHADVIVNSLTKYAANEGDVMLGCLAFPKGSTFQDGWIDGVRRYIAPPYARDLARLAFEMRHYPNLVERTNKNVMALATFLESHSAVKKVHWSYAEPFGANYRNLAGDGKPGCALAFELNGAIEPFYDKIRILKSPSFGTKFSLLCPYVQLAHYDLTQNNQGRNILASAGLSPDLIRVSVGEEQAQEIISVFSEAL